MLSSTVLCSQDYDSDIKIGVIDLEEGLQLKAMNLTYGFIDLSITDNESDSIIDGVIIPPMDSVVFRELGEGHKDSLVAEFNKKCDIGYFLGGDLSKLNPDLEYLYALPFKKGEKYSVSQGQTGNFLILGQFLCH